MYFTTEGSTLRSVKVVLFPAAKPTCVSAPAGPPAAAARNILYCVISEPPLSGTVHFKYDALSSRRPNRHAGAAWIGSAGFGSNCASSPLPPDCRAMSAFELKEFGPPASHSLMQPSARPKRTRPLL